MYTNNKEETIIEHLEALRTMLIHSIVAIVILSPLGFFLAPKFIDFLIKNSIPENIAKLHYFAPMEVFLMHLKIGLLLAFILAFPFIINEIRKFIFPALYQNERQFVSYLVLFSSFLFGLGACICIFLVLPLVMKFSVGFSNSIVEATLGLNHFMTLAISLILAFGLMFQFPLLILMGVKFNLITTKTLSHIRPYVVVGILFFAAILTPPDIISQLILATPTYLLFETGLFIARRIEQNNSNNSQI